MSRPIEKSDSFVQTMCRKCGFGSMGTVDDYAGDERKCGACGELLTEFYRQGFRIRMPAHPEDPQ